MTKYRKKPVVIDAIQWHGFQDGPHDLGISPLHPVSPGMGWIDTLEGGHEVTPGDWIITGVKGEKYPCKPDIFETTYEKDEIQSDRELDPLQAPEVTGTDKDGEPSMDVMARRSRIELDE